MSRSRTELTAYAGILASIVAVALVLAAPWHPIALAGALLLACVPAGAAVMCWVDSGENAAQAGVVLVGRLGAWGRRGRHYDLSRSPSITGLARGGSRSRAGSSPSWHFRCLDWAPGRTASVTFARRGSASTVYSPAAASGSWSDWCCCLPVSCSNCAARRAHGCSDSSWSG